MEKKPNSFLYIEPMGEACFNHGRCRPAEKRSIEGMKRTKSALKGKERDNFITQSKIGSETKSKGRLAC